MTALFLIGAAALFPIVLSGRFRRAAGLLTLLFFGVLFAPWSFDPIVDGVLDLKHFTTRFVWALPAIVLIGIALAHLDARRSIGLLTIASSTLVLGLSGGEPPPSFFFSGIVDVHDTRPRCGHGRRGSHRHFGTRRVESWRSLLTASGSSRRRASRR